MTTDPTIITLTRFPEIFQQFYNSVEKYEPEAKKIVVTSGEASEVKLDVCVCGHWEGHHYTPSPRSCLVDQWDDAANRIDCPCEAFIPDPSKHWHAQLRATGKWQVIPADEPWSFAAAANKGIKACQGDVLLVNDDVQFLKPRSLEVAQWWANVEEQIGILSPQISGVVGNQLQQYGTRAGDGIDLIEYSRERLCFVCVYIKRAVFEAVGYLDESFTGYGQEDSDFCRRAQEAGFKLAVTPDVVVLHGYQGQGCSSSFLRVLGPEGYQKATEQAAEIYRAKWGVK